MLSRITEQKEIQAAHEMFMNALETAKTPLAQGMFFNIIKTLVTVSDRTPVLSRL